MGRPAARGSPEDDDGPPKKSKEETTVRSCAGITYFTSAMRQRGETPYCFGRRGTISGGEATQPEVLERTAGSDMRAIKASEAKKKKPTDSDAEEPAKKMTFVCLGYSQTTAKMERKGHLPLCDVGMRFLILSSGEKPQRAAAADFEEDEAAEPLPERTYAESLDCALATSQRVAARTATAVHRFWASALESYPEKYQKFSKKLVIVMNKQARRLVGRCFGDGEWDGSTRLVRRGE